MADVREPAGGENIIRAKFKGVSIDHFIGSEARAKYTEVSGKPDFVMVSYVRVTDESIKEMDTYLIREDGDGTGIILMTNGDRTEKAKEFIRSMGGEVVSQ